MALPDNILLYKASFEEVAQKIADEYELENDDLFAKNILDGEAFEITCDIDASRDFKKVNEAIKETKRVYGRLYNLQVIDVYLEGDTNIGGVYRAKIAFETTHGPLPLLDPSFGIDKMKKLRDLGIESVLDVSENKMTDIISMFARPKIK